MSPEDKSFKENLYQDPWLNLVEVLGPYSTAVLSGYREFQMTTWRATQERAQRFARNTTGGDLPEPKAFYDLPLDTRHGKMEPINPDNYIRWVIMCRVVVAMHNYHKARFGWITVSSHGGGGVDCCVGV